MKLHKIELKKFRCFEQISINIDNSLVLIEGDNGSGKTSLLEALYYSCYLRSFRSHLPKEMVQFDQDGFFIRITFSDVIHTQHSELSSDLPVSQEIQIGFIGGKKLVKVNKKTIYSYKELINHYKVISLTEDDLMIIKGNPQERRSFIDQVVLLNTTDFIEHVREYKQILNNRNSLLRQIKIDNDSYALWTKQLWKKTSIIQSMRIAALDNLALLVNQLITDFFNDKFSISFKYSYNKTESNQTYENFLIVNADLKIQEQRYARSLFGAHLDDFIIKFQDKQSKRLASRGQQKLILLLLKVAQMHILIKANTPGIFLLDDFMTDFDYEKATLIIDLLQKMGIQLIFTSPLTNGPLKSYLQSQGAQIISLTC